MVKKIQFQHGDFDYCKNQILMSFTDEIPEFLEKMQDFVFHHSVGNGRFLITAPAGRITPTNFTMDDLNRYISINLLSLLIFCLVLEVDILVQKNVHWTPTPAFIQAIIQ